MPPAPPPAWVPPVTVPLAVYGSQARFDDYEGYDRYQPETSRYLRVMVRLVKPSVDVWTYLYNQAWTPEMLVGSGDWEHHLLTRSPR